MDNDGGHRKSGGSGRQMLIAYMERTEEKPPVLDVFGGRWLSVEDTGILEVFGRRCSPAGDIDPDDDEDDDILEQEAGAYEPLTIDTTRGAA